MVYNNGTLPANFDLEFLEGESMDNLLGTLAGLNLAAGLSQTFFLSGWSIPPGENTVTVRFNNTGESTLLKPWNQATITPRQPDMSISSADIEFDPSPVKDNHSLRITATVRNLGTYVGSCNVTFRLSNATGDILAGPLRVEDLQPGDWAQVSDVITLTPYGNYQIFVVLSNFSMEDMNTGNNQASSIIQVVKVEPDIAVVSLTGPTTFYEDEEGIRFKAVMKNVGTQAVDAANITFYYEDMYDPNKALGPPIPIGRVEEGASINVTSGFFDARGIPKTADAAVYIYARVEVTSPTEDIVGNNFLGLQTVIRVRPPYAVSTFPRDGDTGISATPTIYIEFSKDMNRSRTETAFSLMRGSFNQPGSFQWVSNRELEFTPDAPLQNGTIYTVKITDYARDVNGVNFDGDGNKIPGGDLIFSFTVKKSIDTLGPVVKNLAVSPTPTEDASFVTLNATVDDNGRGGSVILGAEYIFGNSTAPGVGEWKAMVFRDTPDSSVEDMFADIDITALPDATRYYIHVRGTDVAGNTGDSAMISFYKSDRTEPKNAFDQPWGGVQTVTDMGYGGALNITWLAAKDDTGPITYFIYKTTTVSGGAPIFSFTNPVEIEDDNMSTPGTVMHYRMTGLTNGVKYYILIRAVDAVGNTAVNMKSLSATPTDVVAPYFAGLDDAVCTGLGDSVRLVWNAAEDRNTDPGEKNRITYEFYYNKGTSISWLSPKESKEFVSIPNGSLEYVITGLDVNEMYVFGMRAVDASGNRELNTVNRTVAPEDVTPPEFGGLVSAVSTGRGGQIRLEWAAATGTHTPVTYEVFVTDEEGVFGAVADYVTTNTFYVVSDLRNGEPYWFRVWATDPWDNTNESSVILMAVPDDTRAPVFWPGSQFTATNPGVGGVVELAWDGAIDTNTDPFGWVGYDISRNGVFIAYNLSTLAYTDTELTNGVVYTYDLRAVDDSGNHATKSVVVTPTDTEKPFWAMPLLFVNDTGNEGEVTVWWSAAEDNNTDPDGDITYTIRKGDGTVVASGLGLDDRPHRISGLDIDETYSYTVRAVDDSGNWRGIGIVDDALTTDQLAPRFDKDSVEAQDTIEGKRVRLTWDAAEDLSGPVVYNIYYSTNDAFVPGVDTLLRGGFQGTEYTAEVPQNDVRYYFIVLAEDSWGNVQTAFTRVSVVPTDKTAPVFLGLQTARDTKLYGSVRLEWYAASDNTGPLTYVVYRSINIANVWNEEEMRVGDPDGTLTSVVVEGLDNEARYYFGVRVYDGVVPPNWNMNTVIKDDVPTDSTPPTFAGLSSAVNEGSGGTVLLNWTRGTDASEEDGHAITYYVYASTEADFVGPGVVDPKYQVGTTTGSSFTVSGLENNRIHYFLVRAMDYNTNMERNTVVLSATPRDLEPPEFNGVSNVVNLEYGGALRTSWDAAVDKYSVTYRVYRSTDPLFVPGPSNLVKDNITGLSYLDEGLVNSVQYYYLVRAVDEFNNMDANTKKLSAVPSDNVRPVFNGLSSVADQAVSGTLFLSWDEAEDTDTSPGSTIVYRVFRHTISSVPSIIDSIYHIGTVAETSFTDTGLEDGRTYYYRVRAYDPSDNADTKDVVLSGVPTRPNTKPRLVANPLQPTDESLRVGRTTMVFSVVYSDVDGDEPAYVRVSISGRDDADMFPVSTVIDYTVGVVYEYSIALMPGEYSYSFEARDAPGARSKDPARTVTVQVRTFIIEAENVAPKLASGGVSPLSGDADTDFTFSVLYSDADGDAPSYVRLVLDGVTYDMNLVSGGSDFRHTATYNYETKLAAGTYSYYFVTSDGVNDPVQTQPRSLVVDHVETPEDHMGFMYDFFQSSHYGLSGLVWLILVVLVLVGIMLAMGGRKKKPQQPPGPAGELVECPSCASKLQVNTPERPVDIECPNCQTQLKIT